MQLRGGLINFSVCECMGHNKKWPSAMIQSGSPTAAHRVNLPARKMFKVVKLHPYKQKPSLPSISFCVYSSHVTCLSCARCQPMLCVWPLAMSTSTHEEIHLHAIHRANKF